MRTDNKDLPVERTGPPPSRGRGRDYGKRSGACFTRAESVARSVARSLARSLALSCQPVLWAVTR